MTVDELRSDLTARLGEQVEQVFSRDGAPVDDTAKRREGGGAGFSGEQPLKETGKEQ